MKDKKLIIVLAIVVVIIVAVIIGINKGKKGEESTTPKENTTGTTISRSENTFADKEYEGLKFSKIRLIQAGNESKLLADVENVSGKDIDEMKKINIVFLDKEAKEIEEISGLIIPLKAGETTEFNAGVTFDMSKANDFKITEN